MTATENFEAEADVLHFVLRSRAARRDAGDRLGTSDFGDIVHRGIYSAMRRLHDAGAPITPASVAAAARCETATVQALWERQVAGSDQAAVRAVLSASARRTLKAGLLTLAEKADRESVPDDFFLDALGDARLLLPSAAANVDVPNIGDLIRSTDTTYDWLVPWMLERGERIMLVAPEGAGKTVLLRQMAFQAAAGIHWASEWDIAPRRVLYVDAENSRKNIVRTSRMMYRLVERRSSWDDERLRIQPVWNLDIATNREQRDTIEAWIERYRPELLVIGPIYKISRNTRQLSHEEAALVVTDVLDGWRERYGCAVAMEHHAPGASGGDGERVLNPFGSTVWRRWPDVGIGLRLRPADDENPTVRFEVKPFRGFRGSHIFPPYYTRADITRGRWPWVATGIAPSVYERDASDVTF